MIIDQNEDLWILCSGGYNEDNGSLVRLDSNDEVIQEIALGMNVSGKMVTNIDLSILYFYSGTTVYSYGLGDESYDKFIENTSAIAFYGIGIAPDGDLYIGDSKGFQSLGSVYVYDEMGSEKEEFQVGRGPNGFVFTSD
jgi:sugar lactone lactonase YvrE